MRASRTTAVLFDLDGTLVDSAPDLAYAVNIVLDECGRRPVSVETLLPTISAGARAMLSAGFANELGDARIDELLPRFLSAYRENVARHTRLFDGMEQVLAHIEARDIAWGIVTNKSGWLAEPLVRTLGLDRRAVCLVSGDTTPRCKPHPDQLLLAREKLARDAAQCVYVGDAEKDVEAARRAGMRALIAGYGYIAAHEEPDTWGADGRLDTPEDLIAWLDRG